MSEQTKLIAGIEELVTKILQNGTVTEEDGLAINTLEDELFKQNSFKPSEEKEGSLQGEEIATLFFNKQTENAIAKLVEYEVTPEDFFGFIGYHYDEEHPDEALIVMFTAAFNADINEKYQLINKK
ncbi:hypothetical protein JHD49_07780 [Sulfurimonas sp. SAG-AH-194-C21]|nr:hypothetical protein [Sulfurimonas sp. SAG-AH-194-C21]MDF1883831.1 hypothetical protein [Sulfurimonas sp. SAG-AH-194-C21]